MLLCFVGVIASFLCSPTPIAATEVKECKGVPFPDSVEITNCDKPPCPLKRGTNITWDIVFTADSDHDAFLISLVATMMGTKHGYPGIDGTVGCDGLYSLPDNAKVGCPMEKGKKYRHQIFMELKLPMPKVTVPVRASLRDKTTKEEIICYEMSITTK